MFYLLLLYISYFIYYYYILLRKKNKNNHPITVLLHNQSLPVWMRPEKELEFLDLPDLQKSRIVLEAPKVFMSDLLTTGFGLCHAKFITLSESLRYPVKLKIYITTSRVIKMCGKRTDLKVLNIKAAKKLCRLGLDKSTSFHAKCLYLTCTVISSQCLDTYHLSNPGRQQMCKLISDCWEVYESHSCSITSSIKSNVKKPLEAKLSFP